MNLKNNFSLSTLKKYFDFLKVKQSSNATLQRKLSSLSSFADFLNKRGLIDSQDYSQLNLTISSVKPNRKRLNYPYVFNRYFILASLIALFLGLTYSLYQQSILKTKQQLAYSTATQPVRPGRIMSFQGRLTDSAGNPITSSTAINFKFFNSAVGGTQLYDSAIGNSQVVVPDSNGIFSVVIGKSHGNEIPQDVFSENPEVWLQITTGDEVMEPRQQIATVAYALNSETVQGLPPSASGEKNTVLVVDNQGNINLGESSPAIKSSSGTFSLEGESILIKATDSSHGGNIKLLTEGTAPAGGGFVDFSNPNISSGNLLNSQVTNTNRNYNFISFQNYNPGTSQLSTRFSVDANGNGMFSNNLLVGSTLTTHTLKATRAQDTTVVTNLNADLLDGKHADDFLKVGDTGYIIGATNGLQMIGNNVGLGGTLTQTGFTTINIGTGSSGLAILGSNNNTQGLTVLSNGSVGIGTNTGVAAKLEIRAPSETAFINLVPTSSTGTSSQGEIRFWGDQGKYGTRYASIRNTNSGGVNQNDLAFLTNAIERMRITDVGRVGIGVTDTNYLFEVAGTAKINGNLTLSSIPTITDNNLVLTSNSGVVSSINTANWDKNAADDYQNWVAKSNTTNYVIGNGTTLSFTPGTDIGIIPSTNNFTFNNTSTLQSVTSRGAITNQQLTISYNGAPFVLSSGNTTVVTNLNADLLDGKHLNELPYAAGATNGLQMIGNNVGLGGTLTQNTIINNPSHSLSIIGQDDAIGLHVSKLGTVGIGLTTPQGIFHIAGRGTANQNFRFDWASNDPNYKPTIFTLRSRDNTGVNAPVVDGDALFMQEISGLSSSSTPYSAARWGAGVDGTVSATSVPGYLYFATTAQGDTGATERLRIASNGNIGIGTSSPQYKLDVNGQIRISNLPTGTTDNVITQNNGVLQTRSIDSRVWGNTLSSGTGTTNYSARWLSTNTLGTGAIYDNGTNVAIGTDNPRDNKLRVISDNTYNSYFGGISIDSHDATNNLHSLTFGVNRDKRYGSIQSRYFDSMGGTESYTNLFLNPMGGNVGIGTTNLTSRLTITDNNGSVVHLRESDTGTRSGLALGFFTNVAAIWGQNLVNNASSPGPLLLNPEGGNVGIGIKNPGYNLHLHNDTVGTSNFMQFTTYNTGISTNDGLVIGYNDADGAKIVNRENSNLTFSTNNSARMTIKNSGEVGIGTTNPQALLHLQPSSALPNAAGNSTLLVQTQQSVGSQSYLQISNRRHTTSTSWSGTNTRIQRIIDVTPMGFIDFGIDGKSSSYGLGFGINQATQMVLHNGNVGIGHTSPTYKLQVAGNAANTTGVWTNYSDSRLKNSIVSLDLSDSLDKITRLNPVAFNWNDPVKNAEFGRVRGFIAQEMETVIPEWVITDPSGYKAIQPIGIDAMLVASIKELNTKLEGLDITTDGAVVVNYNVSDEVLQTLGYNSTKNELENGSYSLTDSLGQVVNRVGQFGRLAVNKLTAGLISSKAVITDNLAAKHVASETIVTGDLVSTQIGTTELTALKIGASEASFSTLYADQIINPEGNISDVMASKIGNLREEIKSFIASASATTEATPSAIAQNAETWDTSIPTNNLELTEMDNLTLSGDLVVGAQLIVIGQTLLQNAAITDMLTVGQIALTQNILETTADTLFIQPSGQGSVDILNGRLLISSDGTIRINSDVIVSGSLTANILKADEIETQKLNIAVATASAESTPSADSPNQNVTNDATAGFITLATGQTEVTINNSQLTANSMVYLTPNGSTQNQVPYIKNKTEDNFTIAIDSPLDHDVNINWWLIN